MTLIERVIRTHRCRSTHHFIAFDALSRIGGEDAEGWKRLFLVHHEHLLEGAKAPDAKFKDFKNHVCHVSEGLWGGAPQKAMEWYAISVEKLRAKKWSEAAYALGVTSHYFADPIQPFHTGQTETEGVIHRAVEWSIAKSRTTIDQIIAATGYPSVKVPEGPGFISDMVLEGAALSHAHYDMFIEHYDFEAGVADPPSGLDDEMRATIAFLVAYATEGFAQILSRAMEEAAVAPPKVNLTVQGFFETLDIPLRMIMAKLEDAGDKATVEKMYREFKKTGKVVNSLPDDDKAVRKMHAREVRRIPIKTLDAEPVKAIGEKHVKASTVQVVQQAVEAPPVIEKPKQNIMIVDVPAKPFARETKAEKNKKVAAKPLELPQADKELFEPEAKPIAASTPAPASAQRSLLRREDPIVDAPSIGRKTAGKLAKEGLKTVADLLDCDAEETAYLLDVNYIDAETLKDWQDQARLMIDVPGLRGHDAQVLVGAGIRNKDALAAAPARTLFQLAREFLSTPEGERVQRDDDQLIESEVADWIGLAKVAA